MSRKSPAKSTKPPKTYYTHIIKLLQHPKIQEKLYYTNPKHLRNSQSTTKYPKQRTKDKTAKFTSKSPKTHKNTNSTKHQHIHHENNENLYYTNPNIIKITQTTWKPTKTPKNNKTGNSQNTKNHQNTTKYINLQETPKSSSYITQQNRRNRITIITTTPKILPTSTKFPKGI